MDLSIKQDPTENLIMLNQHVIPQNDHTDFCDPIL